MTEKSDERLLEWAVRNAGHHARKRTSRWVHVMEMLGFGSTSAHAMCRRFGMDPDEIAGGCSECEDSLGCGTPDCQGNED